MTRSRLHLTRTAAAATTAFLVAAAMMLGSTAAGAAPANAAPAADAGSPATGTNIALASAGATVAASGQEVAGQWGPALAIDGIIDPGSAGASQSRWSSNTADDAQITVKLAKPAVIDHVAIQWEKACAAKYKLQVSTDGQSFVDATDVISPTCDSRDTEKLSTITATTPYQYVRMQGVDRTPIGGIKYGMSLWEFEVWNGAEAGTPVDVARSVVPKPENMTAHPDENPFVLASGASIVATPDAKPSAEFLATILRASTGYTLPVVATGSASGNIVFTTGDVPAFSGKDEAYALTSTADHVQITAPTSHGAFDAVQTLRQLFPAFIESKSHVDHSWTVPAVEITDAPRFAYRGMMLDVARSFLTVGEVEKVMDTMALFKMSTLHFHVADDQGWRLQITNDGKEPGDPIDYSRLTSISGATAMTEAGYKNEIGHTGYYTQDDYRVLLAYAQARHIDVIPEIDAPAHTNAALHAIPQLNTAHTQPGTDESGTTPANGTKNVGYSTLDANAPITWTFMRHVLKQVVALTPGEYIHVGGDESAVTPAADYVTFITKSVQIVHDLGKKMIGWNEAAVGGLTAGDAIQYWTGGTADTLKAVNDKGAKLILSRGSSAYLDQKYNSKTPIGLTWAGGGYFPTYYNWDPASVVKDAGANLPDDKILGVEGPMWSETIRGGQQASFLAFPRAIALAEMGWTAQSTRDVTDFGTRLGAVGQRLLVMDTNFYDGNKAKWQWSMAGAELAVAPGHSLSLKVGSVAAPGTKASENGSTIAVDASDDADGTSASTLSGDLSVSVDWGDGSAATAATFTAVDPRTALHAGSLYLLRGTHAYPNAATYHGTLTASDGSTRPFTVAVAAGTPDPTEPPAWDSSQTPTLTTGPTADAGGRLPATLTGFEPGTYVMMTLGTTALGTVLPDADGTLSVSLPIPASTYAGTYPVTAAQGERTASSSITVASNLHPLANLIDQKTLSVVSVDSQETAGEDAAAKNAIDGDPATYWHTQWQGGSPDYPHEIVLDLGASYQVTGFEYQQRPGQSNGRMKGYDVYVSDTPDNWGDPVATGEFLDLERPQVIDITGGKTGHYLRLVGTSSINGNAFGGAAEINVGGIAPGAVLPTVGVAPATVAAGGSVDVTLGGFAPNSSTALTLAASPPIVLTPSVTTDATGAATAHVTIPADTPAGDYSLVATHVNQGETLTASTPLSVTAITGGGTGPGTGDGGGAGPGAGNGGDAGPGTGNGPGAGNGSGNGTVDVPGAGGAAVSGSTPLADTGSVTGPILFAALLLLMAGAGLFAVRRVRGSRAASAPAAYGDDQNKNDHNEKE